MAPDTEAGVAPCSTVDPRPTLEDLAEAAESVSSSRCVRIKSFSDIPREVIIGLHPGTLVNVSDVRALAAAFNTTATDVAQTLLKHGRELEPGWEQLDAKESQETPNGTPATISPGVAEIAAAPNAVASVLSGDDTEAASTAGTAATTSNERSSAYELSVGGWRTRSVATSLHSSPRQYMACSSWHARGIHVVPVSSDRVGRKHAAVRPVWYRSSRIDDASCPGRNPTLVHKSTQIINKHFHNQDNGFALSDSDYVYM